MFTSHPGEKEGNGALNNNAVRLPVRMPDATATTDLCKDLETGVSTNAQISVKPQVQLSSGVKHLTTQILAKGTWG